MCLCGKKISPRDVIIWRDVGLIYENGRMISNNNKRNMEDRELVNSVISNGDTRCFARIVGRYSAMVYSKALGLTHREELAAEVTQQTFVKAYDRLACWRGQSLGPWLVMIASHTALNILDKEKRRRGRPVEQVPEAEMPGQDSYSEEHEQRLARMERAIGRLADGDRQLIEMHYRGRKPTSEIARTTGMSQSNVLVRLHRIRERLRKWIEDEED